MDGAANPTYSKEAAIIAKIYTEDQKYNRISKSFNFKLAIFINICKRADLKSDSYITAFLIMLKRLVQNYYYNHNLSAKTFNKACTYI
jgi:hypothetical protein